MPELPEVENFARTLNAQYAGSVIQKITFYRDNLRVPFDQKKLKKIFCPQSRLLECRRHGKSLIFTTTTGSAQVGLGMSGAFFTRQCQENLRPHEHVSLQFIDGRVLSYVDPRRFGYWVVYLPRAEDVSATPSPCDALDVKALQVLFNSAEVKKMQRPVKSFLMDQNFIGGIGNIYACEALFRAGIYPFALCAELEKKQWTRLAQVIPTLLQEAIDAGGSSISTYRTLNGAKGNFQNLHQVYGRGGARCLKIKCHGVVVKSTEGNRGTWYCPVCQRLSVPKEQTP